MVSHINIPESTFKFTRVTGVKKVLDFVQYYSAKCGSLSGYM